MIHKRTTAAVLLLFAITTGCAEKHNDGPHEERVEVVVSAAASLTDCLSAIGREFEDEHPGIRITFNFGASGALQRQIEQGAPVDLYISAGKPQIEELVLQKLVDPKQQTTLLKNKLVVIVPGGSKLQLNSIQDLNHSNIRKIAIGQPETVPAGTYAKELLTRTGLWDLVKERIVFTKDVKQALTYVETGNVDAGLVYETDVLLSKHAATALVPDSDAYSAIVYLMAIIKQTKHNKEAEELFHYLQSTAAADVFKAYGFTMQDYAVQEP